MMNSVKNDLNLFKAYAIGPGKNIKNGIKGLIVIICVFIVITALGYAVPLFLQLQLNQQAANIRADLSRPEVTELQTKLNEAMQRNNLLLKYLDELNSAKAGFDESKIIDSKLLDSLTSSMPADVKITSLKINTQSIQMTCSCTDPLAPAKFSQTLSDNDVFGSITYGGVEKGEEGIYTFNMRCLFGGQ